ncbi:MAG: ABC transporter ATP-binding protein [Patescibacteria group bacterium]|jgi:ABC-type multidrug transport system fused ATPase/permease subunit
MIVKTGSQINSKEKKEIIPWKRFWVEFWRLLIPFQHYFLMIAATTVVSAALNLVKPYLLKLLIDGLNGFDAANLIFLGQLIVLYLASGEVLSFIQYFNDRRILKMLVDIEYFLGVKAQGKLVALSLGYHEKENTGSKIIKIERGVDKISDFLNNVFYEVLPTSLQLSFTLGALFWTNWRIGASFLFFATFFITITYWSNKRMYPIRKSIYRDYEIASGKMGQAIININAVQSFVQEKRELAEFDKIKNQIRDNENKQWGWMMKVGLSRNVIVDLGRAVVLFLGVYLVYQKSISVGTLIFAFTLSETAYGSLYRLSRFYDRMEEGREGVNRLLGLFNSESEIINKPKAYKPKTIIGEIKFENVAFYYGENKRPAVQTLNFKINSGCVTALVGPSGGGKTTVARLLYRHYDPQKGRVILDGKDLRDYDLPGFRKFLAIVPQEVEIFDLSVAENIAYARPQASKKEISAAARTANAEEFINKLEKGYNTMVGERGIKLSGGQRQRIGIARAVLANPRILIFDEATSNLDSQSEVLIQDAIEKISHGRTMIIIAHRLSTIKRADKIIVLENGQVAEEGNHASLARANGGLYAKLLKLQSLGDIE